MELLRVIFIDSWAVVLHQPFPFVVAAMVGFLVAKSHYREHIRVLMQRLDARNEECQKMQDELKRSRETLSTVLKSSLANQDAMGLRVQMNLLAAKLLDFSYVFPPLGRTITKRERDEAAEYYHRNIRPELEYLLLRFREQMGQLLETDVRVYCEYQNFEKLLNITHEPRLTHMFGRDSLSEMAQRFAVLALRVEPASHFAPAKP